jgi:hypothetical protein
MEVPAGQAQYRAMKHNLLVRNASLALGFTIVSLAAFAKTPVSEVRLTVRVYDYVNLPAGARDEIMANAKRVLLQAGVSVEFVQCSRGGEQAGLPACTGPLGPADLVLRIFEPKMAVKGEELGYAAMTPEGGACITVFINPAQEKGRVVSLSNGTLLGHAVAHEIGHLLLGANSHSPAGIMRSVWRRVDEEWMVKGALLFDKRQAARMQTAVERIGQARVASLKPATVNERR